MTGPIHERVLKLLVEQGLLEAETAPLDFDCKLEDALGIDSLDLYELVTAAEEEFGISIPDNEAFYGVNQTLRQWESLIERLLDQGAAA